LRVTRRHARAGLEQQRRHGGIAPLGRPVQRRHAVTLRHVHIGALRQQRAHRTHVAAHRGGGHQRCRTFALARWRTARDAHGGFHVLRAE
jgi:hypothetical protein